jgi:formate/nitrite transporter FocA (FNT family)
MVAGAELFTGNVMLVSSLLKKKISWALLLKNWTLIWLANFV